MMTDRYKNQRQAEAKHRDDLISREKRNMEVAKLFFDEQQNTLYGEYANRISIPQTYETLHLKDPSDETDENVSEQFLENMKRLSGGDGQFAERLLKRLADANFDIVSISFINNSFDEFKTKMKKQFRGLKTSEDAVFLFIKKFVQTYDADADGVRDNVATNVADEEDAVGVKQGETKADLLFYIKTQANKSEGKLNEIDSFAIKLMRPYKSVLDIKVKNSILRDNLQKIARYAEKDEDIFDMKASSGKGLKKKRGTYVGRGVLPSKNISDKIYVDQTHLNKNSLCLKYISTKKKITCESINDEQKSAVMDILSGQFTKKKYDNLRSGDKELIYDFVINSKAKNVGFITKSDELQQVFDVVVGQIRSGNDSPDLLKLLKETTEELMKLKRLSRLEALSILSQIK